MTRAYVGLGEGIGNVLMGLPLADACTALGYRTTIGLAMTPRAITEQMVELLTAAGYPCELWGAADYDLAALTHWYLVAGGQVPDGCEIRMGALPSEGTPEVVSNLEALDGLGYDHPHGPALDVGGESEIVWGRPLVALHPGCKPAWRDRKLYPRWHEVVHRLQDMGACVVVVGGGDDADIYCGRPDEDFRARFTLLETARLLAQADVVLSGDSGLHHLAVAVGAPTVALFCQSSVEKARHPRPAGVEPVVLGPFVDMDHFRKVSPMCVARATMRAAGARLENAVL